MFESIKQISSILAEMAKTRFELIMTELEEERLRWAELLIRACVSLFLWAMGLIMASLALIEWMGESHRLQTMTGLALTFIGGAFWATWRWKSKAAAKPHLLAETLIELHLDVEALRQGARGRVYHE
ncbi:MAG: phage holin family protein [Burkholderiales bacterium]|jgi:uncharacterized membrane protein YqjE